MLREFGKGVKQGFLLLELLEYLFDSFQSGRGRGRLREVRRLCSLLRRRRAIGPLRYSTGPRYTEITRDVQLGL